MLPAQNNGAGENFGFPDVCNTPVGPVIVPIPYPNTGMNANAAAFCANILITMMPGLNQGSILTVTTGDEAGVAHPTIKGPSTFVMGIPTITLNGLPAISQTMPTTQNTMNDMVGSALVPSATNVTYTFARADLDLLTRDGGALDEAILEGGVGYLRLRAFAGDVPARAYRAIRTLEQQGMRELILDLRGNPGGELDACVALAGDFLETGSVIVTKIEADGDEEVLRSTNHTPYRFPLLILVDRRTASAAELFAGSLQAHGRATIAGDRTYGKGVGRSYSPALDGSDALWESTTTYLLAGGGAVHGRGVTPDVALPAQHPVGQLA